jgi:tRNA pseudouridine38-40 synthase
MPRYKILIEYDGTGYAGWQRQANAISIQECIEESIESFSQEKVTLFSAGRTDTGVHAVGQVAHFDLKKEHGAYTVTGALNHFLKTKGIVILETEIVDENFHARFSAKKRFYKYIILNRSAPPALDLNKVWHVKEPLNVDVMRLASGYLIGNHDFTSFRASECQAASPVKTIDEIEILLDEDYIVTYISAPSFLHHMVRNIIGTLKMVGCGKWQPEDVKTALEAKDRAAAGQTAPACGLYFLKVQYE